MGGLSTYHLAAIIDLELLAKRWSGSSISVPSGGVVATEGGITALMATTQTCGERSARHNVIEEAVYEQ